MALCYHRAVRIVPVDRSEIAELLPALEAGQMGIAPDVGVWFAAFDDGRIAGVARVTEVGKTRTVDDVYVVPAFRRRGVARALLEQAASPVWLICDEDMVAFYEHLGFERADALPTELAELYGSRGEWPRASDHAHHAMIRR